MKVVADTLNFKNISNIAHNNNGCPSVPLITHLPKMQMYQYIQKKLWVQHWGAIGITH